MVRNSSPRRVQFCLESMLTGREGLHGHTLYNRQRCADELLEKSTRAV